MEYFFKKLQTTTDPWALTVAVLDDSQPDFGNLKAISPEEPRHAIILALAKDIESGTVDSLAWKNRILGTIVTFRKVDNDDDIFWHATNAREKIGVDFEVIYFSTVRDPLNAV